MEFYRITDTSDKWYNEFYRIYSQSFPLHEQRTESQQKEAFEHAEYHLDCLIEGDEFLGFVAWWDFDRYIYIEHLAVNPAVRGKSIGSRILADMAERTDKYILLEIDPLVDEVSRKRFHFYEKAGFKLNTYFHSHPAYREGFNPHELLVLTLPEAISETIFQQFSEDLSSVVMNFRR